MRSVQLKRQFDPEPLTAALRAVTDLPRTAMFESQYEGAPWTGLGVIAPGGRLDGVVPGLALGRQRPAPTEVLDRAPVLGEILDSLGCAVHGARLLYLPAGARIRPHRDAPATFQSCWARLHLPMATHPDIVMEIDGAEEHWAAGELWWGDFSCLHAVHNRSPVERVHLQIDVGVDDALLSLFPPEFVAAIESPRYQRAPLPVTPEELSRYECDFSAPEGTFPGGLGGDAALRVEGEELLLLVDGEPAFPIDVVSESELCLAGIAQGFCFEVELASERVAGLEFVARGVAGYPEEVRVPLISSTGPGPGPGPG